MWADRNPFTDDYLQEELDFYGAVPYRNKNVRVTLREPAGRCDDYLNAAFWDGTRSVPVMYINDRVWMSLTRMEVQSQHLPILWAKGHVGTIGLGLGHFTLRAMQKPEVTKVTVFESQPEVIEYFTHTFSHRPGFDKVEIIPGCGRVNCIGKAFDFLYADHYQTMLPDEALLDLRMIPTVNKLTEGYDSYHFWGLEKVMIEAILQEVIHPTEIPLKRAFTIMKYMDMWGKTPIQGLAKKVEGYEPPMLPHLYRPMVDKKFIKDVLNTYPTRWNDAVS